MSAGEIDLVEPYPGWPASVWLVRLKPRDARIISPAGLRAVARGIDAALGEPDAPQHDTDPRVRKPRLSEPDREPWMPRFPGDMPRMAPFDERNLLHGAPGYDTVAPWRPRAIGHAPHAARAHALARPPLPAWRWRLVAFAFLPDMLHLLLAAPVETDATSVSYRLHRRIAEHLLPTGQARAAPYGQAAQLSEPGLNEPQTPPTTGVVHPDDAPQPAKLPVAHLPKNLRAARKRRLEAGRLWAHAEDSPQHLPDHAVHPARMQLHRLPVAQCYAWHPQQWWWSSYHEYAAADPAPRPGIPRLSPLRPDPRRPWLDDHTEPTPLDKEEFRQACRRRHQRFAHRLTDLAEHAPNPNTRVEARRRLRDLERKRPSPPRLFGPKDPLARLTPERSTLPDQPTADEDHDAEDAT